MLKQKQFFYILITAVICVTGCSRMAQAQIVPLPEVQTILRNDSVPVVYMTTTITAESLLAVYNALNVNATGNVAVKIHTGEPGNTHFLRPALIKDLVQSVNGTLVETNTAYGGRRASTAAHYQVAREHGFTEIAPVVILDERADIRFPVTGGKHLSEILVGARFTEFDFHIVLSHFKGHQMGGFGGALKNLSVGYASAAGKALIHSGGRSRTNPWIGTQNAFLESMAEAAATIAKATGGKIIYINVMNHMSVDCDCNGNPARPTMADIGILASIDPVALDQACVDLVYAARDGQDLRNRIESMNGVLTINYAEELGLGSKTYRLIRL
jgi:hypothetical protein